MRRLHLPIQDPCHADWDAMNRTDGASRFCDSCAKHVHDVSSMTEHEAWTVLADQSKKGRVCVRYTVDGRTGHIKYKVETIAAPAPSSFSGLFAAASVAVALLGSGCTNGEPTHVEADRCVYEVGPWSFTAARGEGSCPDVEDISVMGGLREVDDGKVIEPQPNPDTAVAGGLGVEVLEPDPVPTMGEAPMVEPPQPTERPEHVTMGKIAAPPPTEHVKMGDVGPVDEPCDDASAGQVGITTTPTTPTQALGPRRL
jgi:hypothetical protein